MRHFLEQARIDAYGALRDVSVGPFGPGLNVVFGRNEAGKSTVASFIGAVLFGWEEARGVRNTYRPVGAARSGSLLFRGVDGGDPCILSRSDAVDGEGGRDVAFSADAADSADSDVADAADPDAADVFGDIDAATYAALFALNSDELRRLGTSSDVTARLLTAESGTESSPADALAEIRGRIEALTSQDDAASDSVMVIGRQLEAAREHMKEAGATARLYLQEDRELRELVEARGLAAARLDEADERLETLREAQARIAAVDAQIEGHAAALAALEAESREESGGESVPSEIDRRLLALDSAADRLLRDRLEEFSDEVSKATRSVEGARQASAASAAAYEALVEVDAEDAATAKGLRGRGVQAFVSVALPVAFVLAGVLVFAYARRAHSLALTALGLALVVLAFFLAASAMVVLFRPGRGAEALESRRKDAQWVMLQDKKKLDASLAEKEQVEAELASFLESAGLGAADGSIRQARTLLDEARIVRARESAERQRAAARQVRLDAERASLRDLRAARQDAAREAGLPADVAVAEIELQTKQCGDQRAALAAAYDDMGKRYGELEQRMRQARLDDSFARAKADYHRLKSRLRESKKQLVSLLLAERLLEKSLAAWESRSQPEIYERAGALLADITAGAWVGVAMTATGQLVAVAPDGSQREVRHLSLGTCQQLYLALRAATLMQATSVGRSVPVIADDILVNFDGPRRLATARVLAELAVERQVIVFTCHRATVDALRDADPALTLVEL